MSIWYNQGFHEADLLNEYYEAYGRLPDEYLDEAENDSVSIETIFECYLHDIERGEFGSKTLREKNMLDFANEDCLDLFFEHSCDGKCSLCSLDSFRNDIIRWIWCLIFDAYDKLCDESPF